MAFELPKLSYKYNELEPYIDAETMEIHYSKHHAAYINNLNSSLKNHPELENKSLEDLLKNLRSLPTDVIETVKNNGGGHYNHTLFWETLTPKQDTPEPTDILGAEIANVFGNFSNFKEQFSAAALGRFGSGWAWLSIDSDGKLYVSTNANQENPVMDGCTPILGLDVWEHAYYLKYQNKRADYIANWWNVVNWNEVLNKFRATKNI